MIVYMWTMIFITIMTACVNKLYCTAFTWQGGSKSYSYSRVGIIGDASIKKRAHTIHTFVWPPWTINGLYFCFYSDIYLRPESLDIRIIPQILLMTTHIFKPRLTL